MTEVLAVHLVAFLTFVGSLGVGAFYTVSRVIYYQMRGLTQPRLLRRDVIVIGGIATSFGLILIIRVLGYGEAVRDQLWWAILSDAPAVIAALTYAYYEIFVIERGR